MTTAIWTIVDAAWFAGNSDKEHSAWISGFAWKLYTLGLIAFAATGSWYVFGTWHADVREEMFRGPLPVLTILTALVPSLPCRTTQANESAAA